MQWRKVVLNVRKSISNASSAILHVERNNTRRKVINVSYLVLTAFLAVLTNALAPFLSTIPPVMLYLIAVVILILFIVVNEQREQVERQPPNPPVLPPPVQSDPTRPRQEGKPMVDNPALLCFAIDVSHSMKDALIVHTKDLLQRRMNLRTIIEHFVDLSIAVVQDPATQKVLPRYYLIAYAFGFKETALALKRRRTAGGPVRNLLTRPPLPALPSTADLYEHWDEYKDHMLSASDYTLDLFGGSPLCQALTEIKERIQEECNQHTFTRPILLTIVSDGGSHDGDPQPIIDELHSMGVLTLCCYAGKKDVLETKRLYDKERANWPEGAKLLFRCASPLYKDSYITRSMFAYLARTGWHPHQGVRLFTQVNQAEALDRFLNILLSGFEEEKEV